MNLRELEFPDLRLDITTLESVSVALNKNGKFKIGQNLYQVDRSVSLKVQT